MNKILLLLLFCLVLAPLGRATEPYHFIKEIPVGGDGGWDYLSVDAAAQRLYVSHGDIVVVLDLATDAIVGEITNTPGVHGVALAPERNRAYVSCGRNNKVAVIDLGTLRSTFQVATGQNPDAILYESKLGEVYVFDGRSQSATIFPANIDILYMVGDVADNIVKTIPLGGKPEFAQADSKAGQIYVNLEDKNELLAIDTKTHSVKYRWPIAPGAEATGLAFDEKHHRLFLGCHNNLMLMMDSISGKVLATVPIGAGVDASAFDPGTQLVFASCGDGTVTIAHEDSPDKLTVVQTLPTEKGARTMALNPITHRIYLPSAKFAAPAPGQRRGQIIPGTFKILVYGPGK